MEPRVAFLRNRAGDRIAFMIWGEGPLLVVPPGFLSHLELQWESLGMHAFYARLAESFQLVFYDRRGCGLSERVRHDFSLDSERVDLETVIDAVAPSEQVSLLGVSQGGPICIAYAAAHPSRVKRLVLYGAYDAGERVGSPQVRASLVELVRASWGIGTEALASLFVPGDEQGFRSRLAQFQREAATRETGAALLESVYRFDVSQLLAGVRAPSLVIHRRSDRAVPSHFGVELAAGIPGARLVQLEGAIHFPWLGDWQTIATLIEDFVQGRPPRSSRPAAPAPAPAPDTRRSFRIIHYRVDNRPERPSCRLALAQVGEPADLPVPGPSGLYRLPAARVEAVAHKLQACVEQAAQASADLVVFPEMSVDLNHELLAREAQQLASAHQLMLVLGGHHDEATRTNTCTVLGPEGVLWKQRKHIPALVRANGDWVEEPIETMASALQVVAETAIGRIAVVICRDFLDLGLRLALRNAEPPVDLVINPAFTPVSADFRAAHFEARRALYAGSAFCNFAVFGGSCVESPEKTARRFELPAAEERVEVVDVPLFAMRVERAAWEEQAHRRFVQSTRR